jgi:hypothetical protein
MAATANATSNSITVKPLRVELGFSEKTRPARPGCEETEQGLDERHFIADKRHTSFSERALQYSWEFFPLPW